MKNLLVKLCGKVGKEVIEVLTVDESKKEVEERDTDENEAVTAVVVAVGGG